MIEDLPFSPSGGRLKMWLAGAFLPLVPFIYGLMCILKQQATFWSTRLSKLEAVGSEAIALGIAYAAVGTFLHFHYFLGLHPTLLRYMSTGKLISVVVCMGSFGYFMYRMFLYANHRMHSTASSCVAKVFLSFQMVFQVENFNVTRYE